VHFSALFHEDLSVLLAYRDVAPLKTLDNQGIQGWISSSAYLELLSGYLYKTSATKFSEDSDLLLCLIGDFWFGDNLIVKYHFQEINEYLTLHSRHKLDRSVDRSDQLESPRMVRTLDDTSPEGTDLSLQVTFTIK
jgi:hypothetical protein